MEAERILTGLLAPGLDPFTEAEVLLPLAYLHMNSGALDTAEQELDRYGQLYADLGGNRVSVGNLARARGRLEIVRRGGGSLRDLPRLWVPKTRSRHATCTYSCMRPPSDLDAAVGWPRRKVGDWGRRVGADAAIGADGACCSARPASSGRGRPSGTRVEELQGAIILTTRRVPSTPSAAEALPRSRDSVLGTHRSRRRGRTVAGGPRPVAGGRC
jgi:hypothetical protein